MQKLAKQPQPASATGGTQRPAPPRALAQPGKPADESPAPANTDDTPEEAQMPATPATPENVLTRFDKLLIEFEKQRADAADRERDAAARQEKQNQAMLDKISDMVKENAGIRVDNAGIRADNAKLRTQIEQQSKEAAKSLMLATFGIIASIGVAATILGFIISNMDSSPIVIYASQPPAVEQPAPAPATPQPAN